MTDIFLTSFPSGRRTEVMRQVRNARQALGDDEVGPRAWAKMLDELSELESGGGPLLIGSTDDASLATQIIDGFTALEATTDTVDTEPPSEPAPQEPSEVDANVVMAAAQVAMILTHAADGDVDAAFMACRRLYRVTGNGIFERAQRFLLATFAPPSQIDSKLEN